MLRSLNFVCRVMLAYFLIINHFTSIPPSITRRNYLSDVDLFGLENLRRISKNVFRRILSERLTKVFDIGLGVMTSFCVSFFLAFKKQLSAFKKLECSLSLGSFLQTVWNSLTVKFNSPTTFNGFIELCVQPWTQPAATFCDAGVIFKCLLHRLLVIITHRS